MVKYLRNIKELDQNMLVKRKDLVSELRQELRQSLRLDFVEKKKSDERSQSPNNSNFAWREEQQRVEQTRALRQKVEDRIQFDSQQNVVKYDRIMRFRLVKKEPPQLDDQHSDHGIQQIADVELEKYQRNRELLAISEHEAKRVNEYNSATKQNSTSHTRYLIVQRQKQKRWVLEHEVDHDIFE